MKTRRFLVFVLAALSAASVGRAAADPEVVRNMVLLGSPEAAERKTAAEELGRLGNERGVEPLTGLLADPDEGVRIAAAFALGEIGRPGPGKALLALAKKDDAVRPMAIRALGKIGYREALPFLGEMLRADDPTLAFEAALALGRFPNEQAGPLLVGALDKTGDYACRAAVNVMGRNRIQVGGDRLIRLAKEGNKRRGCALAAVEALGRIGVTEAAPDLVSILENPRSDLEFRAAAAGALGGIPSDVSFAALSQALASPESALRARAVLGLAELARPGAAARVSRLSEDPDPEVRAAVEFALPRLQKE